MCAVQGCLPAYARAAAFQIKCSLRRTANTAPQGGGVLASRLDSLNVLIPCGSGACAVGARDVCGQWAGRGRGGERQRAPQPMASLAELRISSSAQLGSALSSALP